MGFSASVWTRNIAGRNGQFCIQGVFQDVSCYNKIEIHISVQPKNSI